ncbi:hypothetical protein FVE67_05225 [Thermosulfurimonas marina]|uniref:Uncharacterized protein n=1 Tax=Thermosulfurimonas marina TaxID=2047767 RepID=A0A6H1WSV9_9BACT|nr:hypothetical protein [Thermosulfurimonas marina]QJA06239.1 hypothetical protein FVE67_05225 [Thermosulfurimonas marina]
MTSFQEKRKEAARVFFDVSKYSFGAGVIGAVLSEQLTIELLGFILAVGLVAFFLGWLIYPEEG